MDLTNVETLLRENQPEKFDFKFLMKEYYQYYSNNVIRKIDEDQYNELIKDMPEPGNSSLINFLKYKVADVSRIGSQLKLFDCDSSNDTCQLSSQVYYLLWGLQGIGKSIEGFNELKFGPDTMNTVTISLNNYCDQNGKCSVKKLYNYFVSKESAGEGVISKKKEEIEDIFGELLIASGYIGNFVLVPYHFNCTRCSITNDFWDLSLDFLQKWEQIDDKKVSIKWNANKFEKYINVMFLWDYVEEKDGRVVVKSLLDSHQRIIDNCTVSGKRECLKNESESEYRAYVNNACKFINRRGIFMIAMLKIATIDILSGDDISIRKEWKDGVVSDCYKSIMQEVFLKDKVYMGYGEVFDAIKKLGLGYKVNEIIQEAENKIESEEV